MKRIIGYVNTADLNHMREEDVRALTVINIAFGLDPGSEKLWMGCKGCTGWNSIHSEKQPGAEDCIVRRRPEQTALPRLQEQKREESGFAASAPLQL